MFFFRKIFNFILWLIEKTKRFKIKSQCVLCGCMNECNCSRSNSEDNISIKSDNKSEDNMSIKSDNTSIKSDSISIKSDNKSVL